MMTNDDKNFIHAQAEVRREVHTIMESDLPTHYNVLDSIRHEIQAEHTLISHRLSWFVTSQAFLMTAYTVSLNPYHQGFGFFRYAIPLIGGSLSLLSWMSICSAIDAQWNLIKVQTEILQSIKHALEKEQNYDVIPLNNYERITCNRRTGKFSTHWIAMIPTFTIPFLVAFLWTIAYHWSLHLPPSVVWWAPLASWSLVILTSIIFVGSLYLLYRWWRNPIKSLSKT